MRNSQHVTRNPDHVKRSPQHATRLSDERTDVPIFPVHGGHDRFKVVGLNLKPFPGKFIEWRHLFVAAMPHVQGTAQNIRKMHDGGFNSKTTGVDGLMVMGDHLHKFGRQIPFLSKQFADVRMGYGGDEKMPPLDKFSWERLQIQIDDIESIMSTMNREYRDISSFIA